ncbi:hypothetical protein T4A_2543 [Trichinella pseudospiralis]|uniref:Uncharacterized protein n=1 Tax=Trichinella pseudospiralis TaxID=6337 RepID=A0A0V1E2P1_TRIPS|nr:hypothetical protein T4A_2543 [Trichinella pseudospiralis]
MSLRLEVKNEIYTAIATATAIALVQNYGNENFENPATAATAVALTWIKFLYFNNTYTELLKKTDKSQDHCIPAEERHTCIHWNWNILQTFVFSLLLMVGWVVECGKWKGTKQQMTIEEREKSDLLKSDETELRDAASSVADQRELDPSAGPATLLYAGREIAPSAIKIVA